MYCQICRSPVRDFARAIEVAHAGARRYSRPMVHRLNVDGRNRAARLCAAALAAAFFLRPDAAAAQGALFDADEPLVLELVMDWGELCRGDTRRPCEDSPATLIHRDGDAEQRIDVQLRARGNWRNQSGNCSVPPLFVFFDAETSAGTPFESQTMLPLTTHCRERPSSYAQYVLREYLAYRLYNTLADDSLRVRLAHVTYRDTGGRRERTTERYAFFTEHFDALAARHNAEPLSTEDFSVAQADPQALARVELFEYMIGNTDWSIVSGHNITFIRASGGEVTAVPFDFDFSGLVDAVYAEPPPQLPIRSVTQRLYRGFCHEGLDWDALFAQFERARGAAEGLVSEIPGLETDQRDEAQSYLAEFFEILASPEERRERIVEACREGRI